MKVILIDEKRTIENNDKYAVCLGMFDGIHLGHRELILKTVKKAKENNLKSAVLTFVPKNETGKLYPFSENLKIIEKMGIDTVFAVNFTDEFKKISAKYFIDKYLIEYIKASFVICGFNFKFGYKREGDVKTLEEYGKGKFELTVIPEVKIDNETVSSTFIKSLLGSGDIKKANSFLGEDYKISEAVVMGKRLGREISFPTINMPLNNMITPIKKGVYLSEVKIGDKVYKGISNVGIAPTLKCEKTALLETHIIDYSGDLYNKYVTVYLKDFLREEKKFKDMDELKETIKKDLMLISEPAKTFKIRQETGLDTSTSAWRL